MATSINIIHLMQFIEIKVGSFHFLARSLIFHSYFKHHRWTLSSELRRSCCPTIYSDWILKRYVGNSAAIYVLEAIV